MVDLYGQLKYRIAKLMLTNTSIIFSNMPAIFAPFLSCQSGLKVFSAALSDDCGYFMSVRSGFSKNVSNSLMMNIKQ
jgi:hypothetical protein